MVAHRNKHSIYCCRMRIYHQYSLLLFVLASSVLMILCHSALHRRHQQGVRHWIV